MRTNTLGRLGLFALTGLVVGGWGTVADAATRTVNLKAVEYLKCLPKEPAVGQPCAGEQVRMWGFVETDSTGAPLPGAAPSSPGPTIVLGPTHDRLVIRLRNELPADADPFVQNAVSMVIPGLKAVTTFANLAPPQPVTFTDGGGRTRVRSFTRETLPGQLTTYNFAVPGSGTYLYHSGTHAAVQVQMGLYGAITKVAATSQIYPGVTFDREVLLVYSEIDRQLHADVDSGKYVPFGDPQTQTTSTMHYSPTYWLVNGKPYDPTGVAPLTPGAYKVLGDQGLDAGVKGQRTLVRIVNAGLKSHVPVINGGGFQVLAEDGKPYAYPRRRVATQVAAGQTMDVLLEAPNYGVYPIFDRMLGLSNHDGSAGGLYANFVVHDLVQSVRAVYTASTNRLAVRARTVHDLPAGPGGASPTTMFAWGTYANGSAPVSLGPMPFLNRDSSGRWVFDATFTLPAGTTRPDAVVFNSSLGGTVSRAVTVQ